MKEVVKKVVFPFDKITKPSDVIDLVIKGIKSKKKDKNFIFDMADYGSILINDDKKPVCFGCLANVALCESIKFKVEDFTKFKHEYERIENGMIQHRNCNSNRSRNSDRVSDFIITNNQFTFKQNQFLYSMEDAIDALRRGVLGYLFELFGFDSYDCDSKYAEYLDYYIDNDFFKDNYKDVLNIFNTLKKALVRDGF